MSKLCKNCVFYDSESKMHGVCAEDGTNVSNDDTCASWSEISKIE